MDTRFVYLEATLNTDKTVLTVTGPPSGSIYPPGPGFVYVVTDNGVPSFGHKTLIGTGQSPPVNQAAIDKWVDIVWFSWGSMLILFLQHVIADTQSWIRTPSTLPHCR